MYSLLQELRDHYNEVLMQKWVTSFRDIFEADNYHPIQVISAFVAMFLKISWRVLLNRNRSCLKQDRHVFISVNCCHLVFG
jgi:hypothetical protein